MIDQLATIGLAVIGIIGVLFLCGVILSFIHFILLFVYCFIQVLSEEVSKSMKRGRQYFSVKMGRHKTTN